VENIQKPYRATLPPWLRLPRNGPGPRDRTAEDLPEVRWWQEGLARGRRAGGGAGMRRLMGGVIRPGQSPHEAILETFEREMVCALACNDQQRLEELTRAAEDYIPAEPGELN